MAMISDPDPHPHPLAGLLGYALRRAANAMMAELGERLSGEGLRVSDATVLMLAGDGARPTASHIGKGTRHKTR